MKLQLNVNVNHLLSTDCLRTVYQQSVIVPAWQEEMNEDLRWSQSRPAVVRARDRAAAVQPVEHAEPDAIQKDDEVKNPYEAALTEFERKSLRAYRQNWPGMAYSLTQNGATGFAMHSSPDCMHTLIRNLGLVWSDVLSSGQWLVIILL